MQHPLFKKIPGFPELYIFLKIVLNPEHNNFNFDEIAPLDWLFYVWSNPTTVCCHLIPILSMYVCVCVSGGVDTAAGGEEEDQEGLQASPAPFSD